MTILLASTSPRRYHILSLLRLPFLMIPPASAEITSDARLPEREVLYQAEKKAASLAAAFPGTVVIGSDTLINLDGSCDGGGYSSYRRFQALRRRGDSAGQNGGL